MLNMFVCSDIIKVKVVWTLSFTHYFVTFISLRTPGSIRLHLCEIVILMFGHIDAVVTQKRNFDTEKVG